MNVGIIVYSQTGNTLSVAQELEKSLKQKGHAAEIHRVEVMSDKEPLKLKTFPDITPFDAVVFASPVQAFSLAASMKQYFTQINELKNKKVFCFVTQHLKKAWMGGNHALSQMQTACKMKGGVVLWSGGVNWSSDKREQQIKEIVETISSMVYITE